ncbi:MAG TPA: hypothetical protein VKJ07_17035, partial [Mycobacteriales bacterium]|nr:hypothetical protein [Mycobacteriales bacterium]
AGPRGAHVRKVILGGIAVSASLGAVLASGAFAGPGAGKPVDDSRTLCGTGNAPAVTPDGASSESKFGGASFMASQKPAGTKCTNNNSGQSDGTTWTIVHGNISTATERGTEHGQYMLSGSSRAGGFNGHVTDFDFNGGDACQDSSGRTVYYQSGAETDCPPSFGPVGNFNTHGGAQTGDHFRGHYGTIIFQQSGLVPGGPCDVGSQKYCIQVDLVGQTN